jgi:SAM-dependent methyltransferase
MAAENTDRPRKLDLRGLYASQDADEARSQYDTIAEDYDEASSDEYGWETPRLMPAVVQKFVAKDALILDAGAGTGLLGTTLRAAGFVAVDALDISTGMLEVARTKRVYQEFRVMALGGALDYPSDTYDAVVGSGIFSPGHAPPSSFDELIRITKPGGHIIFSLRCEVPLPEFSAKFEELESSGRWELVEQGDDYQAVPKGEPDVLHRIWVFRVR